MATKNELAVYFAGGRMFESQTSNSGSSFSIEKKVDGTGDWEINLKMTISKQDAEKSIFNFADLELKDGEEPVDISNLIFINGAKAEDDKAPGVIFTNIIEPESNRIIIGGKPNKADKSSSGAELHFIVEIANAGKTDQGKTQNANVG